MVSQTPHDIIVDGAAFGEDFVPPHLVGRNRQLVTVENCLAPVRHGRKPRHIWLHGSTGSGKSSTARSVLCKFRRTAGIRYVVINCWQRDSLYEVLDQIVTDLKVFCAEEHRSSAKLERLERHIGQKSLLIVLDEIDKMPVKERARCLYSLDVLGKTGLICISDRPDPLFEIDGRVRSRLNPRTITFDRYSAEETREILADRVRQALAPDTCPAYLIKRIAAVSSGDARVAIQTLRNAAESAQRKGHSKLTPSDVVDGWHDSQKPKSDQLLSHLTPDHRILYQLISQHQTVLSSTLWKDYRQHCKETARRPVATRTFSAYINQMVQRGLLTCERARVKGNVRLLKACKQPDLSTA